MDAVMEWVHAQARVVELVEGLSSEALEVKVPACPAWTAHELVAHMIGVDADILAGNGVIAWFDGRSEFGPRALGHRSLLAHPGRAENLERLNDVKGREQFRPVAPMVLLDSPIANDKNGPARWPGPLA